MGFCCEHSYERRWNVNKAWEKVKVFWREQQIGTMLKYMVSVYITGAILLVFKLAGAELGNLAFALLFGSAVGFLGRAFFWK